MASYGTEYACRAKKGFLRYATRFLKPSVLKTGSWCTDGKFGAKNGLLVYATHLQRRETADSADCGQPSVHRMHLQHKKQPSAAPNASSKAQNSLLPPRMHLRMSYSFKKYFVIRYNSRKHRL